MNNLFDRAISQATTFRPSLVTRITRDQSAHIAESNHRTSLVRKTRGQLVADRSAKLASRGPQTNADHFGRATFI